MTFPGQEGDVPALFVVAGVLAWLTKRAEAGASAGEGGTRTEGDTA